jgi:hypothetical protein
MWSLGYIGLLVEKTDFLAPWYKIAIRLFLCALMLLHPILCIIASVYIIPELKHKKYDRTTNSPR